MGKTTHDTGKFAAVMAMAARVYAKFLPTKAKGYIHLAEFAWDELEKTEEKRIEESVVYTSWGKSLINTEFPVVEVYWVSQRRPPLLHLLEQEACGWYKFTTRLGASVKEDMVQCVLHKSQLPLRCG